MNRTLIALSVACLGLTVSSLSVAATSTLETVKARGQLICGVNTAAPGFASVDSKGNWTGLDVDVCRAVAAATLGDASKVKYVPLSVSQRYRLVKLMYWLEILLGR